MPVVGASADYLIKNGFDTCIVYPLPCNYTRSDLLGVEVSVGRSEQFTHESLSILELYILMSHAE